MTQVTIHQAETHLSRLINQVLSGEDIIIAKRKKKPTLIITIGKQI